jgi:hypothetical protein
MADNTRLIAARAQQLDPVPVPVKTSLLTRLSFILRAAGLAEAGGALGPLGPVPGAVARDGEDRGYAL